MGLIVKVCKGLQAAFKGILSVAGFGILAVLLPTLILKMRTPDSKEMVRIAPKLRALEASSTETQVSIPVFKEELRREIPSADNSSFSFGNTGRVDAQPILDRSVDPNQ